MHFFALAMHRPDFFSVPFCCRPNPSPQLPWIPMTSPDLRWCRRRWNAASFWKPLWPPCCFTLYVHILHISKVKLTHVDKHNYYIMSNNVSHFPPTCSQTFMSQELFEQNYFLLFRHNSKCMCALSFFKGIKLHNWFE